jgi:DNA-binding IclR family transcriptional regulator
MNEMETMAKTNMDPTENDDGKSDSDNKPRVQTAVRTIAIITAVAQSAQGLKAIELSNQLRLPRQVVYHLLHSLSAIGMLRRNDRNRYVLGLSAGVIADGFKRQLAPPEHLGPLVRDLAAATGETCYAVGWVDGTISVLSTARGSASVQAAEVPLGYSSDAYARATGKLLLALTESWEREKYFSGRELKKRTARTVIDPELLAVEFAIIKERRWAEEREEYAEGLCCMAVPVEGVADRYALALSAPTERFIANHNKNLEAMQEIARLGYSA